MFATLRALFAADTARTPARPAGLGVEPLGRRDLPAAGLVTASYDAASRVLTIQGSAGDDTVDVAWRKTSDGNRFDVRQGASVRSFPGNVGYIVFVGGAGNDAFNNYSGTRCEAYGGDGNDTLGGGSAKDVLLGGAGDDTLAGNGESDALVGDGVALTGPVQWRDGAAPRVSYTAAADGGSDLLSGNDGNDLLGGDGGNDTLFGGAGDDDLSGGFGYDWMSGGSGWDVIVDPFMSGSDFVRDGERQTLIPTSSPTFVGDQYYL